MNLHSKQNVLIDARVSDEVAEILVEKDHDEVNEILEYDIVVHRLGKEDSNLEISLEALASQKPMLWTMKKLY